MTRELICEGYCNPEIADLDADIKRHLGAPNSPKFVLPIGDPYLVGRLRALKHTPHEQQGFTSWWACSVCGMERKF